MTTPTVDEFEAAIQAGDIEAIARRLSDEEMGVCMAEAGRRSPGVSDAWWVQHGDYWREQARGYLQTLRQIQAERAARRAAR